MSNILANNFWEIFNPTVAIIAAAAIVCLVAGWWSRHNLGFWRRWQWIYITIKYFCLRRIRRHKPLVVCLDEYVYILEKLRESIVKRCAHIPIQNDTRPEILIYVYTKQLPSDWPLWKASIDENEHPQNALERYIRDFHTFLKQGTRRGYSAKVRRVIVIDNGGSEDSKEKCERIRRDTCDETLKEHWKTYLSYLHNDDVSGATVYWTERPWPGWISDAVFYGIREPGKTLLWLWGITTSYDTGEDLILLRLHRKLNRKLDGGWCSGALVLPTGVKTLEQLANRADDYPGVALPISTDPWEPWRGVS